MTYARDNFRWYDEFGWIFTLCILAQCAWNRQNCPLVWWIDDVYDHEKIALSTTQGQKCQKSQSTIKSNQNQMYVLCYKQLQFTLQPKACMPSCFNILSWIFPLDFEPDLFVNIFCFIFSIVKVPRIFWISLIVLNKTEKVQSKTARQVCYRKNL